MRQLSIFDIIDSPPSIQTPSQVSKIPYLHIEGNIPIDLPNQSFISIEREAPLKIHSLGFQPAKSIPEISRWFLNKYCSSSCHILEPFAGSGTTIVESLIYGASVSWLDYNPLSRLICQVKTSSFSFIDTKYRIGSGDSGTLKKFRKYGQRLRELGFQPVLLIVRNDNLPQALNACARGGWVIQAGDDAYEYIYNLTKFDLKSWLQQRRNHFTL